VTSIIVFKKAILNLNPDYGAATASIVTLPNGTTTLNLDSNMTKQLNGKILVNRDFPSQIHIFTGLLTVKGEHILFEGKSEKTGIADTDHQLL
jgi:hypothetical protein